MKIRQGFVSNSSSASFVIMGFVLDKSIVSRLDVLKCLFPNDKDVQVVVDKDAISELWHNMRGKGGYTYRDEGDDGMPKGKMCVGVSIAKCTSEDGYLDPCEFDVPDLIEKMDFLKKTLKLPDDVRPKIVGGSYCC